jgi:hypothetical protein
MSKIKKSLGGRDMPKKNFQDKKKETYVTCIISKMQISYVTVLGPRNAANFCPVDLQKTKYMSVFVYVIIIKF